MSEAMPLQAIEPPAQLPGGIVEVTLDLRVGEDDLQWVVYAGQRRPKRPLGQAIRFFHCAGASTLRP